MSRRPDGQEDVLKQFFAAVMVAAHAADERQQRIRIASQQNGKGFALPRGDALHQAFIGFVGQFQGPAPGLPVSLLLPSLCAGAGKR